MEIKYNLNIANLNRKVLVENLSNVVYQVSLSAFVQSVDYPQFTYSCNGIIDLDISGLDSSSFVPFEEITKETVLDWIMQTEGVSSIEEISYMKNAINNIQQRVDELQVQETVPVGWSFSNIPVEVIEPEPVVEPTPVTEDPTSTVSE